MDLQAFFVYGGKGAAWREISRTMIQMKQKQGWGLWLGAVAALGVSGCRYGNHTDDGSPASVRLIDAVPDAGGLDVSVDGRRVWKQASFRSSTGYQPVASGTYPVRLEADGSGATLLTQSLSFDKGRSYTLLALGQARGGEPARVQVLTDDTPAHPPADKAALRLVNAAPGTPAVDLVVNTIVGLKEVAYGRRSAPLLLDGGHYDLQLAAPGTADMLVGPVSLNLAPGKSYTLIAMGRTGNQSLSLEVYPDK